jgi:hypothetical protein
MRLIVSKPFCVQFSDADLALSLSILFVKTFFVYF